MTVIMFPVQFLTTSPLSRFPHSFILSMTELSGSIFLKYDLHVEGQWQSHNELSIKISRDHTLNVQ